MKTKLLIFPVILLLTFLIAYLTLDHFNNKNKLLIDQTEDIYLPSIVTSIKLNSKLAEVQRSLQNAVATGNEHQIEETDTIAKNLCSLCVILEEKTIINNSKSNLSNLFNNYYNNARTVSIDMIDGDISEELEKKIGIMLFQYNEIDSLLKTIEIKSKAQAQIHFSTIENNNKKSAIFNILIIFTGFAVSVVISYLYSREIARPLHLLNNELLASEEELRQTNEELFATNDLVHTKNEELNATLYDLKETQSQLIQSEKMASVGLLISGIAHEINNPLNFIKGGVTIINEHFSENETENIEKIQPFLNGIRVGVERIDDIVSSLSRFSRDVKSNTEKCDIHSIIDNCLVILRNRLKYKTIINKEYSDSSFLVIGNEGRLHQSFLNILVNAEQAIEKKGTITIKTTIIKDHVKISILDTGCGIKKENLAQITEAFFTTKDPGKGTGLGLSIASNIIENHTGSLKFNSEVGKGTEAIIHLPINAV